MTRAQPGTSAAALPRPDTRRSASLQATASVPPASPVRGRRRPGLVVLGVVLVGCSGLASAWLASSAGDTKPVLALAHDVAQGQVLGADDLVVVRLTPDQALAPVPVATRDTVVGQRAATTLTAGSLLTPSSVTATSVPGERESVVGVSLTTAQMPAEQLTAGAPVRIVSTPLAQADAPSTAPDTIAAEVVGVSEPDASGARTVDVLVPDLQAAELAARVATGRIALVLDARSS